MPDKELICLETVSKSPFSPCVISDGEMVARVIFSPKHYKNGQVTTNAFEQIFQKSGMSVLRIDYDFDNSLDNTIQLLQKSSINKYVGYARASVKDIREALSECNKRLFYLLDTAREDRIGHADIYAIRGKEIKLPKKAQNMYIKMKISELFSHFEEAYQTN